MRPRALNRYYADDWVDPYHGRGRNGFRDETRKKYRADLARYAYPYFGKRLRRRLGEVTPRDISGFVAWLCDEQVHSRVLADSRVRNIVAPVRACFATAVEEGVIRQNPAARARLPHRPRIEDDGETIRVLTHEQLAMFLALVHPDHKLFFRLLACSGLRYSEAIGLQKKHLRLSGLRPAARVRQRLYKEKLAPPKSKYGRRDVPLPDDLVYDLRAAVKALDDDAFVFSTSAGTPLNYSNLRQRIMKPGPRRSARPGSGSHVPPHLRVASVRARRQRHAGSALARPPLGRVHPRHVRAPHERRHRRAARARKCEQKCEQAIPNSHELD